MGHIVLLKLGMSGALRIASTRDDVVLELGMSGAHRIARTRDEWGTS